MIRTLYILPFVLLLRLSAQGLPDTTWQPLSAPAHLLTRIPLQAREQAAKLIMPGEPSPREPYLIVAVLSATQDNDGSHRALAELHAKAMSNGCDALWVQSFQVYSEQRYAYDRTFDHEYYVPHTMLGVMAYGIRYQRTLPGPNPAIQVWRWEVYDSTGQVTAMQKEMRSDGTPVMIAGYFPPDLIRLMEQISPLSVIYDQSARWKIVDENEFNEDGFSKKKKVRIWRKENKDTHLNYRFHYESDTAQMIREIVAFDTQIDAQTTEFGPHLIPGYDDQQRVKSITTSHPKMGRIRLEVTYLEGQTWSRIDCWRLGPDDTPRSRWFSMYSTPSTAADFQQLIRQEDIHRP